MQMKQRSGNGWEPLYPKTIAENVKLNNGKNIEQYVSDTKELFPETNVLWSGEVFPDGAEVVRPNKPLSECANGWTLVWKRTGRSEQIQHTYIPKHTLDYASDVGHRAILGNVSGTLVMKYFYINETEIKGHSSNESGDNGGVSLFRVYEF